MRGVIAAAVVTGLIGLGGIAAPMAAYAAEPPPGDTSTTLDVTGGSLFITAQANATLTSVAAGATTTGGSLGTVTVTDDRAGLDDAWTATATSSDFANGTITDAAVIPATDITYTPGAETDYSGNATFQAGDPAAMSNDTGALAYSTADEVGNASVSWDPAVSIALPSDVVAGTYTGTITDSVA